MLPRFSRISGPLAMDALETSFSQFYARKTVVLKIWTFILSIFPQENQHFGRSEPPFSQFYARKTVVLEIWTFILSIFLKENQHFRWSEPPFSPNLRMALRTALRIVDAIFLRRYIWPQRYLLETLSIQSKGYSLSLSSDTLAVINTVAELLLFEAW